MPPKELLHLESVLHSESGVTKVRWFL